MGDVVRIPSLCSAPTLKRRSYRPVVVANINPDASLPNGCDGDRFRLVTKEAGVEGPEKLLAEGLRVNPYFELGPSEDFSFQKLIRRARR